MAIVPCSERLARVRRRFASSLEDRILDTYAALPKLAGEGAAVMDIIARSYRRIHDIVGVGPTVGFSDTSRAARAVENVLLPAQSAGRGLNAEEIDRLKIALQALREVSRREMHSF
ncbi:MAG TPA: Hpt domain-containing protein [Xanthobacteraceae bacterium]|nr:Hpt domain-containing protein [Xanthobacteraceae bacterium]